MFMHLQTENDSCQILYKRQCSQLLENRFSSTRILVDIQICMKVHYNKPIKPLMQEYPCDPEAKMRNRGG